MIDLIENEQTGDLGGGDKPFSAEELSLIGREIVRDPPAFVSETSFRLLDVDPWKAHAFWSISPADAARAGVGAEGSSLVLRFADQTPGRGSAQPAFDIAVEGVSNNWYVDLWSAGRSYVADLGVRSPDGGFTSLARSNRIDMPPAGPSQSLDFKRSEVHLPEPVAVGASVVGVPPDTDLFRSLFPKREDPGAFPDVSIAGMIAVSPESVIAGLPPVTARGGEDEPAVWLDSESEAAPAASPVVPVPAAGGETRPFPRVASETIVRFSGEAGHAEARAVGAVAAPLPVAVPPPPFKANATVSVSEVRGPSGGAVVPSAKVLPIENVAALSSFVNGANVEFEINAELIIYGRARPGSTLCLHGRPITVAADGTFSVRRALPQGALILPLLLSTGSADGRGGEG